MECKMTEEQPQPEETEGQGTDEQVADVQGTDEQPQEDVQEQLKPKKTIDERVAELKKQTWEAREAQRQLASDREALEAEKTKIAEQKQNSLVEPNEDNYDDYNKFKADSKNYYAQKAAFDAEELSKNHIAQERQNQQAVTLQREWEYKKAQASEKDPNFIVNENKVDMAFRTYRTHPIVAQSLIKSDMSTELITFLGNNIETAERIATMPAQDALVELGMLKATLSTKPTKKITNAPAPINPVTGGGGAPQDLNRKSFADFEAQRNKELSGQ